MEWVLCKENEDLILEKDKRGAGSLREAVKDKAIKIRLRGGVNKRDGK